MSNLGKLTAAFASATNELTLAAANFSFDFSLMRVEAPIEYHGLGNGLSERRRTDAESGVPHHVARKLGALFKGAVPETPELTRAYGRRVSEIADIPAVNPPGNQGSSIFEDYVGADGTSIWAAATSGPEALQIQLLSCVLARLWDGPEATSIWDELVKERKQEIAKRCEDGEALPYGLLMATQQKISRDQLAEWDASARSWLRTADQAEALRQKQLMLIIDNLDVPVNRDMTVYTSVMEAWKTSLQAVENLIKGMPQSLHQNGAILLGLSSWHLYPDLLVLTESAKTVNFQDQLISPGGILTIGLYKNDVNEMKGVYWSLSLAHLRYYGDPIVRKRAMGQDSSRITFEQLLQVALGSLSVSWGRLGQNSAAVTNFFYALGTLFDHVCEDEADEFSGREKDLTRECLSHTSNWVNLLINAARGVIDVSSSEQEVAQRLIKVGIKHGKNFLTEIGKVAPGEIVLGLCNLKTLLPMLKGYELRIQLLRNIVARDGFNGGDLIIRYFVDPEIKHTDEYASVVPQERQSNKRDREGVNRPVLEHHRWIRKSGFKKRAASLAYTGESCLPISKRQFSGVENPEELLVDGTDVYLILFGDPATAAVYVRRHSSDAGYVSNPQQKNSFDIKDVTSLMADHSIQVDLLLLHFAHAQDFKPIGVTADDDTSEEHLHLGPNKFNMETRDLNWINKSLQDLAAAYQVYRLLPGATISINVIKRPVHSWHWSTSFGSDPAQGSLGGLHVRILDRHSTLSCVALFESGHCNIRPRTMSRVMALSTGNSIFVVASLLCDPIESTKPYELRRIIGNVGRPGITLLIPPSNPLIRSVGPECWNILTYAMFDGKLEDSFRGTSLHLSFTEYNPTVIHGSHGARDDEVFMLESIVSVHDRGRWVADLDVLQALESLEGRRLIGTDIVQSCVHESSNVAGMNLTSVDSWEEFLDPPETSSVVRAYGNWSARLCLVTVGIQKDLNVLLCPDKFCWKCYEEQTFVKQPGVYIR